MAGGVGQGGRLVMSPNWKPALRIPDVTAWDIVTVLLYSMAFLIILCFFGGL